MERTLLLPPPVEPAAIELVVAVADAADDADADAAAMAAAVLARTSRSIPCTELCPAL